MKGGKRMRISATVVVGDGKGQVGVGHGKAVEVAAAVRKAAVQAQKQMVKIAFRGHTIPHETWGKFGASKVLVKPAAPGTGLIACPQVRAVLEAAGLSDALSKAFGSRNHYNTAKATILALQKLRTIDMTAQARNKPIRHFVERRQNEKVESPAG
uniref:Small ribosomal subunit protein uS5 n=1 Tax=candidate division WOR-3 bacterium TaxID=2052148 RepID=A0A7C3ELZ9_UNCW3